MAKLKGDLNEKTNLVFYFWELKSLVILMQNEYIHSDPKYYITEGTNEEDLKNDDLFDVYCVVYKVKSRLPSGDNNDMYSFTTKFEQAFKRFKLFPHGYATIIRILTNDEKIIKLAIDGTTEPYKEDEIPAEIMEALNNLKISDLYGGIISPNTHLSNIVPLEPLAPPSSPLEERQLTLGADEAQLVNRQTYDI